MHKRAVVLVSSLLLFLAARPSLSVTTVDLNSTTPQQLAQLLAGPGVVVSNVTFTGANVAGGSFTGGVADGLGIESGVILSSGNIASAAGPNLDDGVTAINKTPGDPNLNVIVGETHTTFDAAVLEFDFVPSSNTVSFRYVFASDEYNEFVGEFNDVFAFFIDGQNVALIPSTSTPVAINTVNLQTNSAFYRNNDPSDLGIPTPFGTQFDGFTTVLTATATLTPNVSHHIKLAIADTDDDVLDSAVFLQAASFVSQNLTISKSAPSTVASGSNLTYTITYGNSGNAGANNVVIRDSVPAGTTFVSATNGGIFSDGVVSWNIGTVPAGTTGQTVSFTVQVTATSGTVTNSNYTIEATSVPPVAGTPVSTTVTGVSCPTITLLPATLPNAVLGSPYSRTITASGGTGPYSFTVTSGSPPPGVLLSSGGVLSGTPTATGEFSFTVTATDSNECTGARTYSIFVTTCAAITISPSTLANATIGGPFRRTLQASGGRAPYTFQRTAGSLPPGATLSLEGVLTGTLTTPGTYNFTVTATDANGCTGSVTYTLRVVCASVMVLPATLPAGALGLPYVQILTAEGGREPHSFSVTAGVLPAGVTLSREGVLSGTPTASGNFSFTVTATDASGCSGARAYTISVCVSPVTLSPAGLPAGSLGSPYSQTVTASGGTAPYAFAVSSGALPEGMTLSPSGVLSGTPTASGDFSFTITATDTGGCPGAREYTLLVCTALALSPATLPAGSVGTPYGATITSSGGAGSSAFTVTGGALPPGLTLSATGALSGTPTQSGVFSFTVTATDPRGCFGTRGYSITVTDAPPVISGLTLTPAAPGTPPTLPAFTLSIAGSGFAAGAVVVIDGVTYPATFVSPNLLIVTIPASAVPTSGSITVLVVNPGTSGGTSNPATLTLCSPPAAPENPTITVAGNPAGPLTATDFLLVQWDDPAVGPAPSSYEFRINGDPYMVVTGTSAVVAPRGSNDPITLYVRAHCNGDVSGPEVASATYSLAPPVADFTFSAARVGSPAVFTDTSSPQATSWFWIFDDGATSTAQSPTHTFTTAGTHRVALIASNGSGSSQRIKDVLVSASTAGGAAAATSTRPFETADGSRWTLRGIKISADRSAWLELSASGTGETVVYLRFVDGDGRAALERRLAIPSGETSVNDVGAYGLEGSYTLEIVADRPIAATLTQPKKRLEIEENP
jgi:uncharacterized repeat protein (TIGR01451 family)